MASFFILLSCEICLFSLKDLFTNNNELTVTSCKVRAALFHFIDNIGFMRIYFKGIHPAPLKIGVRGPLIQEII